MEAHLNTFGSEGLPARPRNKVSIARTLGRWLGSTHLRGRAAERAAARWLSRRGFTILRANYRTRAGEIDLIAREGDTLCFVEVKARSSSGYGTPLEAVTPSQITRISRAAQLFLAEERLDAACRFDVVCMDRQADGSWRLELVRNAFEAPDEGGY